MNTNLLKSIICILTNKINHENDLITAIILASCKKNIHAHMMPIIMKKIPYIREKTHIIEKIMNCSPESPIIDKLYEGIIGDNELKILFQSSRVDLIYKFINSMGEKYSQYIISDCAAHLLFNYNVDKELLKYLIDKYKFNNRDLTLFILIHCAIAKDYRDGLLTSKHYSCKPAKEKIIYLIDLLPTDVSYISLISNNSDYDDVYKYIIQKFINNMDKCESYTSVRHIMFSRWGEYSLEIVSRKDILCSYNNEIINSIKKLDTEKLLYLLSQEVKYTLPEHIIINEQKMYCNEINKNLREEKIKKVIEILLYYNAKNINIISNDTRFLNNYYKSRGINCKSYQVN